MQGRDSRDDSKMVKPKRQREFVPSAELESLIEEHVGPDKEFRTVNEYFLALARERPKRNGDSPDRNDRDPFDRVKVEAAVAGIRELRQGSTLEPGLTIRDLIDEGRH